MIRSKLTIAATHIIGWLLFIILIVSFIENFESASNNSLLLISVNLFLFTIIYIALFYTNYFLLFPKLYLKKKFLLYFSVTFILLLIIYFIRPFDNFAMHSKTFAAPGSFRPSIPPPFIPEMQRGQRPPPPPLKGSRHIDIISLVLFIVAWSLSGALQLFKQWTTVMQKAVKMEAEKATAELSFLRSQINPHFLFNTLNNIYSLSVQKSDSAPAAIMKLSKIMRYVTDEVTQDHVPLEYEIDCLVDYIDLQKLRLSKKVQLDFSITGNPGNKKVAPLVLMPFVENVFKYGISNHEPAPVTIKLSIEADKVFLFCSNKIFSGQEQMERAGVGISNTVRRLEHLYEGKYDLKINRDSGFFAIELTLFI